VVGKKNEALSPAMQKKYCLGTGKAMHAMQYSKPKTYNAVQKLPCYMHVGYRTNKFTLPVMPLTVPVRVFVAFLLGNVIFLPVM
jgi:hypothetical protein